MFEIRPQGYLKAALLVAGAVVAAQAHPAINRQEALEQRNRSVAEEWAREMEQGSIRAAI